MIREDCPLHKFVSQVNLNVCGRGREKHLQDFFSWFVMLCNYICRSVMLICMFS